MTAGTEIVNIGDLIPEPALVIVGLDGKKHPMQVATVGTFIANAKTIESLGTEASPVQEFEAMVEIILRGFPTLTREELDQWPVDTVNKISEMARGKASEVVTDDEEEASSGNDQPGD